MELLVLWKLALWVVIAIAGVVGATLWLRTPLTPFQLEQKRLHGGKS